MTHNKNIASVYNPDNQTKKELIENFIVREQEFNDIFTDIENSSMIAPEQHYLIQAQRGQGKTTLLLRLFYEIQNSKKLNTWLIPIKFAEELYKVRTLSKFWENIAEHLEDVEGFDDLYEEYEEYFEEDEYDDISFDLLNDRLEQNNKKLILFIDNIGDLLAKFKDEETHKFREILLNNSNIRVIGASSVVLESSYDYNKPFFDFFKIINLQGLNQEETNRLLSNLAEDEETKEFIKENSARIETLRRLTGGFPRTLVLLYDIFTQYDNGSSFKDLEALLDRVTPLYKHRMDDLSPNQQEIVDTIAMHWDAITTAEIVKKTRMESKVISAQLRELEKNQIINKEKINGKNNQYFLSERFFNIWYLMRYGRKNDKNRVIWLTKFLDNWCDESELLKKVDSHIKDIQEQKLDESKLLEYTEALSKTKIELHVKKKISEATNITFEKEHTDESLESEVLEEIKALYEEEKYQEILDNYSDIKIQSPEVYETIILSALKLNVSDMEFVNEDNLYYYMIANSRILLSQNSINDTVIENINIYLEHVELNDSQLTYIQKILTLLISLKYYDVVYNIFENKKTKIKEKLKPIYYVLMYFMQEKYPNEYKKAPPEVFQTVEEIIAEIKAIQEEEK